MRRIPARFVLLCLGVGIALAADIAGDLTGTWRLNPEKSRWGEMQKPDSVVLVIDHKEPALNYSGSTTYANEGTREFVFHGAIDGRPYPMTRSMGTGKVWLRRINPLRFESTFRGDNGLAVETAVTTISADGHTLTRQLRLTTPEKTVTWTEVYERH